MGQEIRAEGVQPRRGGRLLGGLPVSAVWVLPTRAWRFGGRFRTPCRFTRFDLGGVFRAPGIDFGSTDNGRCGGQDHKSELRDRSCV
ncbi:hypothetical protein [Verrucosispora sp. WMMD573]|uniref:hypothetical protein n=1 Tax=Verrucosispora sp. WMMD573 TaxID=3015149 RepID=UPI00248BC193|nr:hypothetical protein [Verrucosispora sp. WMMD573]WBB53793.1 hypothetical protein O7601_25040 [Verrucosispora sp. WMMD573]